MLLQFKNKKDFLTKSLKSPATIEDGNYTWAIFDLQPVLYQSEDFLVGNLSKYSPKGEEKQADTLNKQTKTLGIKDKIIAEAPFVLHIKSGLIAYHIVSNKISQNQFCTKFSEIVMKANDYLLVEAEIQSLNYQRSFLSEIKNFDIIYRINIYLHPSNPRFAKHWKDVDEKIKNINAEKYTASYSNKNNGLNIDENENDENKNTNQVVSEIYMAEDGYGIAKAMGIKDKKPITISTKNTPVTASASSNIPMIEIIRQLFGQFANILDRMSDCDENYLSKFNKSNERNNN